MNITNDYPVMVFKQENTYGTFYSLGISKKNQDGNYINGYMPCQFKNNVNLEDKTKIYIKKAWLSFYLKDKETKPYIFINEFETLDETIKNAKEETKSDPYAEFGEQITINDDDLPF